MTTNTDKTYFDVSNRTFASSNRTFGGSTSDFLCGGLEIIGSFGIPCCEGIFLCGGI